MEETVLSGSYFADIIFYAMTLYNNTCTCVGAHCVKLLASYIANLATVAKQSVNSTQSVHKLLSILICL